MASGVRGFKRDGMTVAQNNFHVDPPVYAPQGSGNSTVLVIQVVDQNGTSVGVIVVVVVTPPPQIPQPAPAGPPRKTPGQTGWEAGGAIVDCALGGAGVGAWVGGVGAFPGALIGAPVCGIFYSLKRAIWG